MTDPLTTLRADPYETIVLKTPGLGKKHSFSKAELAAETVHWLAEFAEGCALGPETAGRIARIRELGVDAARASAPGAVQPFVFPTDIAIKRSLFDRTAQARGFADLSEVGRACVARPTDRKARGAVDALVIADVFFSSPNRQYSTYELASRSALFVRPQFERPLDLHDLSRLPAGVSPRDCIRASLLTDPSRQGGVRFCDWDHLCMNDGIVLQLANPWSEVNQHTQ